ncbi:MAG TPA: hypothetical protein VK660_02680 [Xanthomonadaceae bacterium]|nr:hypothetical protein [Xanthomonadaceae bacterium]
MKPFTLSLLACVAACALAGLNVPVAVGRAKTTSAPVTASKPALAHQKAQSGRGHSSSKAKDKPSRDKPTAPAPTRVVANKRSNKELEAAEKSAQADRDARAERIYRSSQLSAPIVIDAKACKRKGTNGESIYENC